jgi:hypothetical protein
MKKDITLNIAKKVISIDKKPMNLEDSFTDAFIDNENSKELVLNLKYIGNFSEDNSPIYEEMDKLRETYGEKLCEEINISGSMPEDAHYLSFYGNINPNVI